MINRHAGKLLVLGLLVLGVRHGRAWQRDRRALQHAPHPQTPPPPAEWPACPKVSILVAAWNEASCLPALIESFSQLRYPDCELVLCAGGEDNTYELASGWASARIRVLQQEPGEGKFRSMARCFAEAQGPIVMLTDADCRLNDIAFEALIEPLATGAERAVTGRFRPYQAQVGDSFVRGQWARQRYPQVIAGAPYSQFLTGANCAVRRELLADVWEAEVVDSADDLYLATCIQRQGARIRFVPSSCVDTRFPATPAAYIHQQARWRRGHLALSRRFGKTAFYKQARLTLVVESIMLFMPVSVLAGRIGAAAWILAWLSYALANVRFGWVLNGTEAPSGNGQVRGGVLLVVADFAASALALIETVVPRYRNRW